MITQLRFKNWRSLKDVTIPDLQPINVFIGANSSGKTNILDALHFRRDGAQIGWSEAAFNWGGRNSIMFLNGDAETNIEIEITVVPAKDSLPLTDTVSLKFSKEQLPIEYYRQLRFENRNLIMDIPVNLSLGSAIVDFTATIKSNITQFDIQIIDYMKTIIEERFQLLNEGFITPTSISPNLVKPRQRNLYTIESDASNVLFILEYMKGAWPELFAHLQEDLAWLLEHVEKTDVERTDREIQLFVSEKAFGGRKAPTISAGTLRMIAILTTFYALDMNQLSSNTFAKPKDGPEFLRQSFAEMPGLVVIEEPDTALNPGLLKRFVEQIRVYAQHENPRQFIFTTHNPSFLNFFEPEEVRVVERNEQGYTSVHRIPPHIKEIWLDKYGLGEVWTTRSFGGVPE